MEYKVHAIHRKLFLCQERVKTINLAAFRMSVDFLDKSDKKEPPPGT
jgi:hypothetical protein